LNNNGTIAGLPLNITATGNVTNSGNITGPGNVSVTAGNITNTAPGNITGTGNTKVFATPSGFVFNNGTIGAIGNTNVSGTIFNNATTGAIGNCVGNTTLLGSYTGDGLLCGNLSTLNGLAYPAQGAGLAAAIDSAASSLKLALTSEAIGAAIFALPSNTPLSTGLSPISEGSTLNAEKLGAGVIQTRLTQDPIGTVSPKQEFVPIYPNKKQDDGAVNCENAGVRLPASVAKGSDKCN
jgi:hypothetical protein